MHLAPHVRGHQADDALGLGGLDAFAGIDAPRADLVEPQPAVRIEHDLDHVWIGERGADRRPEGGAQHLTPASLRLLRGEGEEISHDRSRVAAVEPGLRSGRGAASAARRR